MIRFVARALALALLLFGLLAATARADTATLFREANEKAARGQWQGALEGYRGLGQEGVRAPSLYWNWAQAASAGGRKGEALWAYIQARHVTPRDPGVTREIERLRAELGLDPSEISLGLEGDARLLARRLRFDIMAVFVLILSIAVLFLPKPRPIASVVLLVVGLLLLGPYHFGAWRQARAVIVQKDAPLLDDSRAEAIALANLREGEVVPILEEVGEFVKIQDASGARGFAHRDDVRRLEIP